MLSTLQNWGLEQMHYSVLKKVAWIFYHIQPLWLDLEKMSWDWDMSFDWRSVEMPCCAVFLYCWSSFFLSRLSLVLWCRNLYLVFISYRCKIKDVFVSWPTCVSCWWVLGPIQKNPNKPEPSIFPGGFLDEHDQELCMTAKTTLMINETH